MLQMVNNYNAHTDHYSQSKGNQTMKFGQLTKHKKKKFSSKIMHKKRQGD